MFNTIASARGLSLAINRLQQLMQKKLTAWSRLWLMGSALTLGIGVAAAHESTDRAFTYQNPIDFSYPYYDGTTERTITELRDPAIIREGDRYYLIFTVFPFTHSTSRDPNKIDCNSPPGIRLYSSSDLKSGNSKSGWSNPPNCLRIARTSTGFGLLKFTRSRANSTSSSPRIIGSRMSTTRAAR